jgi:hypothetical protein
MVPGQLERASDYLPALDVNESALEDNAGLRTTMSSALGLHHENAEKRLLLPIDKNFRHKPNYIDQKSSFH